MVHNLWELKKKIRRKLNEKFEFRFRVFYDNIPKNFKPIYEFTCPCPSSCAAKIKTRKKKREYQIKVNFDYADPDSFGVYSLNLWNGDNPFSLTHNLVEDLREQVEDNDCLKNDPECSHNGNRCYNVLTGQFHCACNDGYYGKKCESLRRKSVLRGRGIHNSIIHHKIKFSSRRKSL